METFAKLSALALCTLVLITSCESDGHHDKTCLREAEEKLNTALLTVVNGASSVTLAVYMQTDECYECDLINIVNVNVTTNCTLRVDSRWPLRVEIRTFKHDTILLPNITVTKSCSEASLTELYVEGGQYSIYIIESDANNDTISCLSILVNDPMDPNIPIYVALAIGFVLVILWIVGKYLYRKDYFHRVLCLCWTESMISDLGEPTNINQIANYTTSAESISVKERLKSLDTFRGIAIVLMVFVNYRGGQYWFFHHSKWNGVTVADVVFPWFVFIMGTAMALSLQVQIRRSVPKWKLLLRILKRSATLFVLGLLINSFGVKEGGVEFDSLRIPGVLQRFGGTYLISASVFVLFAPTQNPSQYVDHVMFRDITLYWPEWIVNLIFVAIHLSITFAMPVPGCPTGYLGPGGLEKGGKYFNCTGGASGYIDRNVFGSNHIYSHTTGTEIYHQTVHYDPEGLLGTLNTCFMCFLGLQAGKILFVHTDWVKRCKRLLIWTVLTCSLALLLCEASLNDGWIPINKNLWSLSYVLALSSSAFFLLMVCYLLIDVFKIWSGAPFYYAGMNAIGLYCGHELFSGRSPVYFAVPSTHTSLLAISVWGTTFWVLMSVYFYYKKIFISV